MEVALKILRLNFYWMAIFVIATKFRKEYFNITITMFLCGMFISEVISYGIFFELWNYKNVLPQNPSPFMIHIEYSLFLALASLLLLRRILFDKCSKMHKFLYILFFLTVTGNLFLTNGRTGQVAYIFGIIVMVTFYYKISIRSFIVSLLLLVSIFTIAYNSSKTFHNRSNQTFDSIYKIYNHNDFNSSLGIRVAYWVVTYDIFKKYPLGVGLGDYMDTIKTQLEDNEYLYFAQSVKEFMSTSHPHNQYLLIILQMGVIGIAVFIIIIFNLFSLELEKKIKSIAIIFYTIFFISSFAEPLLLKQFTSALFVLFTGMFIALSTQNSLTKCSH
jgi:O-antigen ligase